MVGIRKAEVECEATLQFSQAICSVVAAGGKERTTSNSGRLRAPHHPRVLQFCFMRSFGHNVPTCTKQNTCVLRDDPSQVGQAEGTHKLKLARGQNCGYASELMVCASAIS